MRQNGLCRPRNINEILEISQFIFEKFQKTFSSKHSPVAYSLKVDHICIVCYPIVCKNEKKAININMNTMIMVPHQRLLTLSMHGL